MNNKKGFTLVEIMIVVAIIGLLAAIAIPSFLRARENSRRNGCINNLRQIDGAKEQYALERGRMAGDSVIEGGDDTAAFNALVGGTTGYIKEFPFCPSGDTTRDRTAANSATDYTVNVIGVNPVCRLMGDDADFPHVLPTAPAGS